MIDTTPFVFSISVSNISTTRNETRHVQKLKPTSNGLLVGVYSVCGFGIPAHLRT
jgi:hypothetical protein